AEDRVLLRHDNADRRLTPLGRRVGLVNDDDWERYERKISRIEELSILLRVRKHEGETLHRHLCRTETKWEQIAAWSPDVQEFSADVIEQVVLGAKYAGYVDRQTAQGERVQRLESKAIPATFGSAA